MKLHKTYVFIFLGQLISFSTFAAIPPQHWNNKKSIQSTSDQVLPTSEAKTMTEKLTGKKSAESMSIPDRALSLARQSKNQKKFIQAIKRYNYIIQKFPGTTASRNAFLDKAQIYNLMGLRSAVLHNQNKAQAVDNALLNKKKSVLNKTAVQPGKN